METCSVVLTFESVIEILKCADHLNETSSAVLGHGTFDIQHSWGLKGCN